MYKLACMLQPRCSVRTGQSRALLMYSLKLRAHARCVIVLSDITSTTVVVPLVVCAVVARAGLR